MKNSNLRLLTTAIPWATIIALLFFLVRACDQDCSGCYKNSVPIDEKKGINEEDITLNYDCSKTQKFQPIHLDMVNQFGILAKMDLDTISMKVNNMYLRLREPGDCQTLGIDTAIYKKSPDKYENTASIHEITITLGSSSYGKDEKVTFEEDMIISENDLIEIHIKSLSDLPPHLLNPVTYWGQKDCTSRIIASN